MMTLIDKKQLLSDIVNLTMPIGISSKSVDATYMDGYLEEKKQRESEIIDIINKQQAVELEKPKKKRKFRAMTIEEYCAKGNCGKCEYHNGWFYCDYLDFNKVNRGQDKKEPYKIKNGKYIMIEVKE